MNLRRIYADPIALGLCLGVDVLGWSLDRFADVAEPTAQLLAEAAEAARWVATLSRCVP